jgi:hypothetical protein
VNWVVDDTDPTLMFLCSSESHDLMATYSIKTLQKTINGACSMSEIVKVSCDDPKNKDHPICKK